MTTDSFTSIFQPVIVDDIEFYVSNNPLDDNGFSISALSKLAGKDRKTVSLLCNNLQDSCGENLPKELQNLIGKVFISCGENSFNHAKIIRSKAASRILRYYAYESRYTSEKAKESYDKFADIGIDAWIESVVGISQQNDNTNLAQTLGLVLEKITKMEQLTNRYVNLKEYTSVTFPNLNQTLDELEKEKRPVLPSGQTFNITMWLESKGYYYGISQKKAFGRMASEAYKATKGYLPPKGTVRLLNGRYQPNATLYSDLDIPLLEMCLREFENRN